MMITTEAAGQQLNVAAHAREAGPELIAFLHGWGMDRQAFEPAFFDLDFANYSMCSFDFPGFGESDKPADYPYDLETQAAVAEQVIRSLNPQKVHIVGHSMGGGIGLLCARQLVKSGMPTTFISVEGNLTPEDTSGGARRLAALSAKAFERAGYRIAQVALNHLPSSATQEWARAWQNADPHALQASVRSLIEWSDGGELPKLFSELPTKAYLYGERSSKRRERVAACIDPSLMHAIPEAGHSPMIDNPAGFYRMVKKLILADFS